MNNTALIHHHASDHSLSGELIATHDCPCASILLNLHRPGNMLKQNLNTLSKAVKKTRESLDIFNTTDNTKRTISERLDQLAAMFVNDGTAIALGLFASETQKQLVTFPFPVNECTVVGKSFQTRDVLYLRQYLKPYFVVNIGKDEIHLFRGAGESLTEVRDGGFPLSLVDDYEYEHASIGSSHGYALKGFEKDRREMSQERHDVYVKKAAHQVSSILQDKNCELIVVGPGRMASEFKSACAPRQVAGHINRSFNGRNFSSLASAVWNTIKGHRMMEIADLIKKANDAPLNQKAEGLRDVWRAANKGRGLLLLVERDFQRAAYQPCGYDDIRLYPPKGKYEAMADAVDDVIETVVQKHGSVVFTEHSQLARFDGTVLLLRY
jgi:hypothetical protein